MTDFRFRNSTRFTLCCLVALLEVMFALLCNCCYCVHTTHLQQNGNTSSSCSSQTAEHCCFQHQLHQQQQQDEDEEESVAVTIETALRGDKVTRELIKRKQQQHQLTPGEAAHLLTVTEQLRDAVFGLQGRRASDECLTVLSLLYAKGKVTSVAQVAVDIVNVGELNAQFGHDVTNSILQRTFDVAMTHLARLDDVSRGWYIEGYRLGGDELAFNVVNVPRDVVMAAVDRAAAAVEQYVNTMEGLVNRRGDVVKLSELTHAKHGRAVTGAAYWNMALATVDDVIEMTSNSEGCVNVNNKHCEMNLSKTLQDNSGDDNGGLPASFAASLTALADFRCLATGDKRLQHILTRRKSETL